MKYLARSHWGKYALKIASTCMCDQMMSVVLYKPEDYADKTQYMVLTLQLNASVSPPLTVNGEEIAQTKSAKLLGITIDEHLSLKKDQVCHVQSSAIYI